MRVLVTGATRMIGNAVVEFLYEEGHEIVATSNEEINNVTAGWKEKVVYIPLNILDYSEMDLFRYFRKPDAIVHLAWSNLNDYRNRIHTETIYPRHLLFLKNLLSGGLKDITVTGTCLEYGMQEGELSEDFETIPVLSYATGKDLLRKELESVCKTTGAVLKWLRLFYIYGGMSQKKTLLNSIDEAVKRGDQYFDMSQGDQLRDFIHIKAASMIIGQTALQKKVSGIINGCSGKPVTVRSFAERYIREKKYDLNLRFGILPYPDYEPFAFWGSTKKMKEII